MAMAMDLHPRQVHTSLNTVAGCAYNADAFSAVDSCIYGALSTAYPTCYNYYSDKACCGQWLSWEYSYLSCVQTAYQNCFDFTSYASSVSAFLPCYTDSPITQPNSAAAQTTTSVPKLVLETISRGTPTTMPTHSPIPTYSGSGNLLQGYCVTPDYILLDGPTAYWAPVVGCVNDKTDCCPYSVAPQTDSAAATATTVTVVSTITVNVGPTGASQTPYTGLQAYPIPADQAQATLARCPNDYVTVSGGCCPSGYQLWNAVLGGQVPCYSSLGNYLTPPAVPITGQVPLSLPATALGNHTTTSKIIYSSTTSQKPTSAIVNIVYAVQYPLTPAPPGLTTGAKAGIGAGASVAGIAIIVLALLLFWRTRKHKKDKEALTAIQTTGPDSTRQSQSVMSTMSPYAYSTRTELHTDGPGPAIQTPGSFSPQEQVGYFPQQQTQQGYPPQGYPPQGYPPQGYPPQGYPPQGYPQQYPSVQQPVQQMQQIPMQPPVQYPSPPSSTVSPPPPSDRGYGYQGAYPPPGSTTTYAPSSTGSQGAGYSYQPTQNASEITRRPVGSQAASPPVQEMSTAESTVPVQQPQSLERQELHGHSNPTELGS